MSISVLGEEISLRIPSLLASSPESLPVEVTLGREKETEANPILSVERARTYYRQESGSVRSLFGLGENSHTGGIKIILHSTGGCLFHFP